MAPRQHFPVHDRGGLAPSRDFLSAEIRLPRQQHQHQHQQHLRNSDECNSAPSGPSKSSLIGFESDECRRSARTEEEYGEREEEHLCPSDLGAALDDDDDDEEESASASTGLDSSWPSRHDSSSSLCAPPKQGVEIFVGGLTRSTRRDMLRDWFQHAGEVTEVRIARDKRRRRCRGYGYVRFATSEQANRAIETMHRFEFKHGRFLGVLPSDENRTLFVGGLREDWSCDYISNLLKEIMPGLKKVEPIPDRENRFKIRPFCFLEFHTHEEAALVSKLYRVEPTTPPAAVAATMPSPDKPLQSSSDLQVDQQYVPKQRDEAAVVTALAGDLTAGAGDGSITAGSFHFKLDSRINSHNSSSLCSSVGGNSGFGAGFPTTLSSHASSSSDALPVPSPASFGGDSLGGTAAAAGAPFGLEEVTKGHPDRGNTIGRWDDPRVKSGPARGSSDGSGSPSVATVDPSSRSDSNSSERDVAASPKADVMMRDGTVGTEAPMSSSWSGGGSKAVDVSDGGGGGGVPLMVGGAVLKVDWADPLRYHIHLNGGIKGSSPPPELGMLDGGSRSSSRSGGLGHVRAVQPSCVGVGPLPRNRGYGANPDWQEQHPLQQQQSMVQRHPTEQPRWLAGEAETIRTIHNDHYLEHRQYHYHHQEQHHQQRVEVPPGHHHRHSHSTAHQYCSPPPPGSPLVATDRGYTVTDSRSSAGTMDSSFSSRRSQIHDDEGVAVSTAARLRHQQQQQLEFGSRARATSLGGILPPHHHYQHHSSQGRGQQHHAGNQDFGGGIVSPSVDDAIRVHSVHPRLLPRPRHSSRSASAPSETQDHLHRILTGGHDDHIYRGHGVGHGALTRGLSSGASSSSSRVGGRSFSPEASPMHDAFRHGNAPGICGRRDGVDDGHFVPLGATKVATHLPSRSDEPTTATGLLRGGGEFPPHSWDSEEGARESWLRRSAADKSRIVPSAEPVMVEEQTPSSWLESGGSDSVVVPRDRAERRSAAYDTSARQLQQVKDAAGFVGGNRISQHTLHNTHQQQQQHQGWKQWWARENEACCHASDAASVTQSKDRLSSPDIWPLLGNTSCNRACGGPNDHRAKNNDHSTGFASSSDHEFDHHHHLQSTTATSSSSNGAHSLSHLDHSGAITNSAPRHRHAQGPAHPNDLHTAVGPVGGLSFSPGGAATKSPDGFVIGDHIGGELSQARTPPPPGFSSFKGPLRALPSDTGLLISSHAGRQQQQQQSEIVGATGNRRWAGGNNGGGGGDEAWRWSEGGRQSKDEIGLYGGQLERRPQQNLVGADIGRLDTTWEPNRNSGVVGRTSVHEKDRFVGADEGDVGAGLWEMISGRRRDPLESGSRSSWPTALLSPNRDCGSGGTWVP